jgi:hypothetical protein
MSDANHQPEGHEPTDSAPKGELSRRALIRAGLSVAPVVAALKTDLVLAATGSNSTVRPSSFASMAANHCSVTPGRNTTGYFISLSDCKTRCLSSPGGWKYFTAGGTTNCGFIYKSGLGVPSPSSTLKTVMNISMSSAKPLSKLAVYCGAGFLSAHVYADTSFITKAQCQSIWGNQGNWSPVAGVNWTLDQTLAYFDNVFATNTFACT